MKLFIRLCAYAALFFAVSSNSVLAQPTLTWAPLAWSGPYLEYGFLPDNVTQLRKSQYYTFAKSSFGFSPLEACSNAYIATFNFLDGKPPLPFETRTRKESDRYQCEYKSATYNTWNSMFSGMESSAYPLCTDLSFELLKLDY
jgi:hypothetical protein